MSDLHYLELTEAARRIHAGEISPVELTEAMLRRIERLDGKLYSYALVTPEQALAQASKAEAEIRKGRVKGPLHGVPIAVKDLCCTKGVVTTAGMAINAKFKPRIDATVVRRLREAGAVLLGKLQMTEGAFSQHHPRIKAPVNPWNGDYWTGASSSGSGAATAAGLCFGSLGSDTGGSIRFPSAANSLTGLKPTWGRVSRHGVFDLAPSLDHVGPMTRSAADCAAMLGAIAGVDDNDPTTSPEPVPNYMAGLNRPVRGLRIGVDAAYNSNGVDKETKAAPKDAVAVFKALGADLRKVTLPSVDEIVPEWLPYCAVETATVHAATYPKRKDEYGPVLAGLIDLGRSLSAMDYQRLVLNRLAFNGALARVFEHVDLLLVPVQPSAAPTLADMATLGADPHGINRLLRFTAPFDYSGSPCLTLPGGFTEGGLPVGFQLVGRHFEEDVVLRAGHAFQRETDWHKAHPKV